MRGKTLLSLFLAITMLTVSMTFTITANAESKTYYRAKIYKNGGYGLIDEKGNELTDFVYGWCRSKFNEGLICLEKNDKWGFLDINGNEAIPFIYDTGWQYGLDCYTFSEGLAAVCKDEKWGYIDKNNDVVLPFIYSSAYNFSNGIAEVILPLDNGDTTYAFIDKQGKIVKTLDEYDSFYGFNNNCFAIIEKDDMVGYINRNGEETLFPGLAGLDISYASLEAYIKGITDYILVIGEWYDGYATRIATGAVDINGNEILPMKYDCYMSTLWEGYRVISAVDTQKYGLLDRTGAFILPCTYDNIRDISEGVVWAKKDGKCFYIDIKNNCSVIKSEYEAEGFFSNGLGSVVNGSGKYGFINRAGKLAIPCEYDYCSDFYGGVSEVQKDGKYGFIYTDGSICVPLEYEAVGEMVGGIAAVKKDGKWGYIGLINHQVTQLVPCKYEDYDSNATPEAFETIILEDTSYYVSKGKVSKTECTFSFNIETSAVTKGTVIVSVYDDKNKLLGLNIQNAEFSNGYYEATDLPVEITGTPYRYKIMLWCDTNALNQVASPYDMKF